MESPELIDYCRQFLRPDAELAPDAMPVRYVEIFDSHLSDLKNDHQINIFTFHTSVPESASKISLPDVAVDHGAIDYDVICEEMVRSALAFQPGAHVFFVTDADTMPGLEHPRVSVIRLPLQREFPMYERVQAMWAYVHSSLYQKPTVFLDSDAFINKDISWVFHENMDLAVTFRGGGLMPINEGVFFANAKDTEAVARFFDHYLLIYRRLLSDPVVEKTYGDVRRWRGGQLSLNTIACPLGLPSSLDTAFFLGAKIDYHTCSDLNFSFDYALKEISHDELGAKSIIHLKGNRKGLLDHVVNIQSSKETSRRELRLRTENLEFEQPKVELGGASKTFTTLSNQHQRFESTNNEANVEIIFVGNNTFVGFTICEHFEAIGKKVAHLYVPRQNKRCRPEEYFGENPSPQWSIQHTDFQALKDNMTRILAKSQQEPVVISIGEIESYHLCKWGIKHRWIADGSDLTEMPFRMSEEGIKIREALQNSPYIEYVFGSQFDIAHSCRLLGLRDRHIMEFNTPPPLNLVAAANKRADYFSRLATSLGAGNSHNEHVDDLTIITVARRVYSDNKALFSKGTELICPALKEVQKSRTDFSVFATLSGPDANRFAADIEHHNICNVTTSPHLTQADLLKMLQNDRVLILDQFGDIECAFSGILRESTHCGAPTISNQNLRDKTTNLESLFFRATSIEQIVDHIHQILSLSPTAYFNLRNEIIVKTLDLVSPEKALTTLLEPVYSRPHGP